jgi:hypothetical protein
MRFDPFGLLRRLVDAKVDFVVIGGLAATLHGAALPTLDLDIMYERSRSNLERLALVLQDVHVRLRGAEDLPLPMDARLLYAGDRFTFTTDWGDLDVFATADGAAPYEEIRARASPVDLGSFTVFVADLHDLIEMKRAVMRQKDHAKLAELLELLDLDPSGSGE